MLAFQTLMLSCRYYLGQATCTRSAEGSSERAQKGEVGSWSVVAHATQGLYKFHICANDRVYLGLTPFDVAGGVLVIPVFGSSFYRWSTQSSSILLRKLRRH